MPYISSKNVAAMRKAIKAAFPDYKFSITKHHHSTVNVVILAGPLPIAVEGDHWRGFQWDNENPAHAAIMQRIKDIMNTVEAPRTLVEDSDYGTVPTFYRYVTFGEYGKPYVCTATVEVVPVAISEPEATIWTPEAIEDWNLTYAVFCD